MKFCEVCKKKMPMVRGGLCLKHSSVLSKKITEEEKAMIIEVKKRKLGGCQYEGCNKISITKSSGLCSSHIKCSRKKQDEQNTVQKRPLKEGCIAGFVYLIENEKLNIQKIGITGQPETRLAYHGRKGFKVIELWVGSPETASRVEFDFIKFIKSMNFQNLFDFDSNFSGMTEVWRSDKLRISSISLIVDISGLVRLPFGNAI